MRDDEARPAVHQRVHRFLDQHFRPRIDRTRRFIQDHDLRIGKDGARDRQQLLLSLRNVVGFLVQDHVITIRQCPDKVIHLRSFRGSDDFLIRRIQFPVADVFHNGAVV
ncbi:hypothetical protein SDC9_157661 [bioreactor metagenome]|uniref:Uncharacterized protein n=1 Tax=bioreactor metagenome TaxID=1076179 RepID=A0A645F9R6_9ZZZZ